MATCVDLKPGNANIIGFPNEIRIWTDQNFVGQIYRRAKINGHTHPRYQGKTAAQDVHLIMRVYIADLPDKWPPTTKVYINGVLQDNGPWNCTWEGVNRALKDCSLISLKPPLIETK